MLSKRIKTAIIVSIFVLLLGCSAGGGETGTGLNDRVTVGVIAGFGSVIVNGVKYETSNALIELDGAEAVESELSVGMLISLKGSVNADGITGTASTISSERNVSGVVLKNDIVVSNRLDVMGQIVIVDNDTIFESNASSIVSIEDIVAADFAQSITGNVVEISGYTSGDGTIYATRILLKRLSYTQGEKIKVQGVANNVTTNQFQIGKQTFSYDPSVLKDFGGVVFSNNNFVSIETVGDVDGSNNYIATQIKLKAEGNASVISSIGKEIEIEGYISHSMDNVSNIFSINGHQVKVDGENTKFESGSRVSLIKGVKVKIEGVSDSENIIIASQIEIKKESNRRFDNIITQIDETKKSIVVSGKTILITNITRLKDDRDDVFEEDARFFKFESLNVGDFVEVNAYQTIDNDFIATRLTRDNLESNDENFKWELEGAVTALDPLTIDSQIVELSGNHMIAIGDRLKLKGIIADNGAWTVTEVLTINEWEIDEGVITSIDLENDMIIVDSLFEINISNIIFNASLQDIIEIKGIEVDGVRIATEMEIEDDENDKDKDDSDEDDDNSENDDD